MKAEINNGIRWRGPDSWGRNAVHDTVVGNFGVGLLDEAVAVSYWRVRAANSAASVAENAEAKTPTLEVTSPH